MCGGLTVFLCVDILEIIYISLERSTNMQASADLLKDNLWGKLKLVFSKYLKQNEEIDIQSVEEIPTQLLKPGKAY